MLLTDRPTDVVLTELLDALPDAVIWMRAVRDEANRVVNFRIEYTNHKAQEIAQGHYQVSPGTLVLRNSGYEREESEQNFRTMCTVVETCQPHEFSYFNVKLNSWLSVNRAKFGDGILSVTRNESTLKTGRQAIEQQADLLNSVLNGSMNGIMAFAAIRDDEGTIQDFTCLSTNEAGCRLVGRSAQELMGDSLLTIFPNLVKRGVFGHCVHTTETGQPLRTEVSYVHDRRTVWIDLSTQKLGDGFVVTFSDVSAAKQAAKSVEQAADQLRTVIDAAQVAIYLITPIWDDAGHIVDFRFRMTNQRLASYVDLESGMLVDEPVSRWFPAYLHNGLFSRYKVIYETGQTQHFNFHYQTDRIDAWISLTGTKLGDDVLITFSDFTDFKKLQQRLEASAMELQTVIDTSQTGIFLLSPVRNEPGEVVDFRFRVANQQLARYVGQKPGSVIGSLGSRWFPDYKTNGLFDAYCNTYVTGETQRFNFNYDGGGIKAWLDIMVTRLGDEVLVTFTDYTSLKELQQQLENSVTELKRSNKNLEQFAYVASHDLQEPLRKIQAFGDILQAQYAPQIGDGGTDIVRRMQSAAGRMQVLIKDVLAYSRIAARRETVGPVDLNQLMRDVLTDIDTAISEKQAQVTVGVLPTVRGDAAQLRQLFQNLISNALKFTKTDEASLPVIAVSCQQVNGREVPGLTLSSVDADQSFYLIEVTDNGIGFDPRQAERIFQVFQRLHNRSEYQGTGIGLAIVQKVVENHHGYIVAEGRPGEGATFRIALPNV